LLSARRFVRLGALSTIVSHGIFVLCGLVIPPFIAHAIGFSAGLAISVTGLGWIFERRVGMRQLAIYSFLYVLIFATGQVMIWSVGPRSLSELLATSVILLGVSSTLVFIVGRTITRFVEDN
jgi:putative flippase GtrA